ncbi:hypothetical protein GCM10011371_10490 [Novosphingobium marinum]|uniref:Molybdopterin synthase sulfur carrier subunit n=1 Tax=Novosphingobium marinum TaxID=1514948 RepID=A0A7Y9XXY1_9SPHN|nr:MoaD/ThiS family protein [Novosphingobium marinum]NYH95158.1 molybdopterin synthase sulfur carrier subunit [Novosphingobium marinum]GGC24784.1 hypothetical protein GCM10011371_10490 [Novosphingobium marinum]
MAIRLVFLGKLADVAGAPEVEVDPAPNMDGLLRQVDEGLAGQLETHRIRVSLNGEIVADGRGIRPKDGDEIAFLPPVSGG